MTGVADAIREELAAEANPERAEGERKYLKSQLKHLGVSMPGIRRIVKAHASELGSHAELVAAAGSLWDSDVHERRMAAAVLLELRVDDLEPGDLDLLERMLRGSASWAFVDSIAASIVGPLAERNSELYARIDGWAVDENFWMRRSALLALLLGLRAGRSDLERFSRYADPMLGETEFFIRKAIGWVLRDTSRRRPDMVYEWLLPRAPYCSGVTLKEALKYLSSDQKQRIQSLASQARRGQASGLRHEE